VLCDFEKIFLKFRMYRCHPVYKRTHSPIAEDNCSYYCMYPPFWPSECFLFRCVLSFHFTSICHFRSVFSFSSLSFLSCFSLNLFFFLVLSLSPLPLSCCLSALLIPSLQVTFLFLFLLFAHIPLSHSSPSCTRFLYHFQALVLSPFVVFFSSPSFNS
jgi:hypothetical protein